MKSGFTGFLAVLWLVLVLLAGAGAPFVAGEVPLCIRDPDGTTWPALGGTPRAPDGRSWNEWTADVPDDVTVWMPPIRTSPERVRLGRSCARPDGEAWLGADAAGRDVAARLVWGSRTASAVSIGSVILALLIGIPLGLAAGWTAGRGWFDWCALRWIEAVSALPMVVVALAVAALVGPSWGALVAVIGLVAHVGVARVVRGEMLSLREAAFVEAARLRGVGTASLLYRHMLPALRGQIAVTAGFVAAAAIAVEAALAFLGLGSASTISWGGLLADGRTWATAGAWHLWVFPGLTLGITALAIHTVADRLGRGRIIPVRAGRRVEG